ncbi:hypothetical protein ACIRNY_10275 [Capnocytophaga canimorsus]|uniref:hypothetical protein n=1 Tax=Capnocytophaga canimorsus TaxID=28188 RepID=UPI00384E5343
MLFVQWNKKHFFMSVTLFSVLPFQSFDLILSSVKNNPTNPMHHFKRVLFCVFFLSSVFGVGFSYAQCGGGNKVGEVTPIWGTQNGDGVPIPDMTLGQFALVNVVKGIQYEINAFHIQIYYHNGTQHPANRNPIFVRTRFTAEISGQVCVYYTGGGSGLHIKIIGGQNTIDIPRDIPPPNENNKWRGHFYKGANESDTPPLPSKYLGYFDLPESFNTVTNSTLFQIYSQGSTVPRLLANSDYFRIRFLMRSTRKGLYYVNLGADDGTRLEIDNNLVYDNWDNKSRPQWEPVNNQIINLSGNSLLSYEFYNGNGRLWYLFEISDANKIIENTISGEQTICQGGQASPITGDNFNRKNQHNFNPTFQFQWHYATNPNGRRTAIAGATQKDFTPDTKTTPFNQAGTYYLFREASVRFKNIGVAEKTEIIFSNAVKVTVLPQPIVSIDPPKELCQGTTNAQIRIKINNGSGGTPPFTFHYKVGNTSLPPIQSNQNIFHIPVNTSEADTFKYKYLYVTDGNGCRVTLEGSDDITVMAPSITAPENVAWCLPEIVSAVYDNNGNTTITENGYQLSFGDTALDVVVNSVPCCPNPTLKWKVDDGAGAVLNGERQPSAYADGIFFENDTDMDKTYTITYWLECNGQKYNYVTRQIRITPRPQIHFSN